MNASIIRRIRHLQRWESGTIRILGLIELMLAATLIVTAGYAFIVGENPALYSHLIPIVGGLGLFQVLFFSSKSRLTPALGILLIAEMWIISFIVSAIPFLLFGFSVEDAFFEAISGYTTTGASIVEDLDELPSSLLLWRGVMQWAGGITVLISFSFLLPMIGMAGAGLNSNEFAGSDSDNYSLKISAASLNFLKVYILLTVAEILALMAFSVNDFDALCIALSNIPTGGLLPRNDGMAGYSMGAQAVTLIFMILGSANFYMMFRFFFKKDMAIIYSKETRFMLKWFLLCSFLVFLSFLLNFEGSYGPDDVGNMLWNSIYAVISSGTGTGFAITDLLLFPPFVFFILYMVEFMGGASGSTAGGIKMYRLMAIRSYVLNNISRVLHPNAVVSTRSDGKNMSEEAVNSAVSTVFLFIIGLFISLGLIIILEPDIGNVQTYFGIVLAALTNAGIGPLSNYESLTIGSKILMCFLMWLGRMEFILILILFTRGFWTDVRLSLSHVTFGKTGRGHSRRR